MSKVVKSKAIKSNRVKLERTCISCRDRMSKPNLLKMVKCGDGVVVDLRHNMPGRGCYVCCNTVCIQQLNTKKALNRVYKCNISQLVYDQLMQTLGDC